MTKNLNIAPYFDDFDPSKNYHRILFKPGAAVQSRELTQSQTILQDQVTKFADNIFKQNSPVTGGQVTSNLRNCYFIKLLDSYNGVTTDVDKFAGQLITNATGNVVARVLTTAASTGTNGVGDPPTLFVTFSSGGKFKDGDIIYVSGTNISGQLATTNSVGFSSICSIDTGVFYVNGYFVQVNPQTVVLSKYTNNVSARVGLKVSENLVDYVSDSSLLDPALGASNYQAPGADRYQITLTLTSIPLQFGDDNNFIELIRFENGLSYKQVDGSVYNVIDDYISKRTSETNGDYIVNDFLMTPKTDTNSNTYVMQVGKGIAYIRGYRAENKYPADMLSTRSRMSESVNNNPLFIDFGNYFYVSGIRGANNTLGFDVTQAANIDLHCVATANINTSNSIAYTSTLVGTGYMRGLVYSQSSNDANANTYIYKAYVNDLQGSTISGNAVAATVNTVTFPANWSISGNAYAGVTFTITAGKDAGDRRTVSTYDGTTKIATVSQNFTTIPDTTSVITLQFAPKDTEVLITKPNNTLPITVTATANIDNVGKLYSQSWGDAILENPVVPEMIYKIGNDYVSNVSGSSYTTTQVWRNVAFTGSNPTATLTYTGAYVNVLKHLGTAGSTLSADTIKQNFTIIVTDKLSNSKIANGEFLSWTTAANTSRSLAISSDSLTATISTTSTDLSPFTATIIEKVFVTNGDNTSDSLRIKNLIKANTNTVTMSGNTQCNTYTFVDNAALTSTGQVKILNAGLVKPGDKQSLYLVDVRNIVKIIDTRTPGTAPTLAMLTSPTNDITNNYLLDTGQRDNFYDFASITLKQGAIQCQGDMVVFVNYYQHAGGDGYFSKMSYINVSSAADNYTTIPNYVSSHGTSYRLRDCIDFRPSRNNANTTFAFRTANPGDSKNGVYLPVELTTFLSNYSYYLGRKDRLVMTKTGTLRIIEGVPGLHPILPPEPDDAMVLANIIHNPYTGYIPSEAPNGTLPDLTIDKVKHKRFTMLDIAGLENRISNIEYYTALSLLEQEANSLQIQDTFGLNRFKNGIMVDDFSSYATSDTSNRDFYVTINNRIKQLTSAQTVRNYPLKAASLAYNMGQLSDAIIAGLTYAINTERNINYFSLPFTTTELVSQKLASRTVLVNPFSTPFNKGSIELSPNMDIWTDTNVPPALLVSDPNLQVFQSSNNISVLSTGDWQSLSGISTFATAGSIASISATPISNQNAIDVTGSNSSTITNTLQAQVNNNSNYNNVNNLYTLNNGYIVNTSILPWIRAQQVAVKAHGMLHDAKLKAFFDGVGVTRYIRRTNQLELTNVVGSFQENEVIGYYTGGVFTPTGVILGVYNYANTSNIRLYIAADKTGYANTYTSTGTIQNATFDTGGVYSSNTAYGTLNSSNHLSGTVASANNSNTTVVLSKNASSTDNYYVGNAIFFLTGTSPGSYANVTAYAGSTKTITLDTTLNVSANDQYSIGRLTTDGSGQFFGIFYIPANAFHTGERILSFDNRTSSTIDTATTAAQGVFYAQGLSIYSTPTVTPVAPASPAPAVITFTPTETPADPVTPVIPAADVTPQQTQWAAIATSGAGNEVGAGDSQYMTVTRTVNADGTYNWIPLFDEFGGNATYSGLIPTSVYYDGEWHKISHLPAGDPGGTGD